MTCPPCSVFGEVQPSHLRLVISPHYHFRKPAAPRLIQMVDDSPVICLLTSPETRESLACVSPSLERQRILPSQHFYPLPSPLPLWAPVWAQMVLAWQHRTVTPHFQGLICPREQGLRRVRMMLSLQSRRAGFYRKQGLQKREGLYLPSQGHWADRSLTCGVPGPQILWSKEFLFAWRASDNF